MITLPLLCNKHRADCCWRERKGTGRKTLAFSFSCHSHHIDRSNRSGHHRTALSLHYERTPAGRLVPSDFFDPHFTISPRQGTLYGPILGTANGIITAMTGSFVVPGVIYPQAIGLPRDMLIQTMGILFTLSTVGLALALQKGNILSSELVLLSAYSILSAIMGMIAGKKVRQSVSEQRFRSIFFFSTLILDIFIISKSAYSLSRHPFLPHITYSAHSNTENI